MTIPFKSSALRGASALAMVAATAAPSLALTPQDVWDQWQGYFTSAGYEITARAEPQGADLAVRDLRMSMPLEGAEDETGTVIVALGDYTFEGGADGSVNVRMPDEQTIEIHVEPPEKDGEAFDIALRQSVANFTMTASGTPEDIDYTYTSDSIALTLDSLSKGGTPVDFGAASLTIDAVTGDTGIRSDNGYTIEQTLNATALSYDLDVKSPEPDANGRLQASGSLRGLTSTGGGMVPEGIDPNDMAAAMEAGYSAHAAFAYEAGESRSTFRDGEQALEYQSSSTGGQFDFGLEAGQLSYSVSASDVTIGASGNRLPFPVNLSAATIGMTLQTPLTSSEEARPFGTSITLGDVALPDQIWAMLDPAGGFAHDPLTIEIALSGTGRLFVDFTDDAEMTQLGETGGTPGEIETLKLDKLTIRGAGAEIGAVADFQIDNEARSPLASAPNFWGTANIRMTGVQGLLNTLSQMGLVPPAQAMMASGMISQLGRPVSGPDDLEADVELSREGALSVNGSPMPLR